MTRSELIEKLYERNKDVPELELQAVEKASKVIFKRLVDALAEGDRIEIRGFGSFSLRKLNPHTARNPKTGENLKVGNRFSIYFRPGKTLKERVNSGAKK